MNCFCSLQSQIILFIDTELILKFNSKREIHCLVIVSHATGSYHFKFYLYTPTMFYLGTPTMFGSYNFDHFGFMSF